MNTRIAFFNGNFIEEEKIFIQYSDLAIHRGYGVFDFFKVVNDRPVFMTEHLDRLFNSAAGLELEPGLTRMEIANIAQGLINRNKLPYSGIKVMLTGGYSPDFYTPAGTPNLIITQQPMSPRPASVFEKGFKVITYEHVRELPEIKSINYITGIVLQQKLLAAGADDALYYKDGEVSEFPRSNFFIVMKDNRVITPSKNILKGITRAKTLELARKYFTAEEGTVTLDDIREAKEAFMTSTSKQIIPIKQVDDIILNKGEVGQVTRFLDEKLSEITKS